MKEIKERVNNQLKENMITGGNIKQRVAELKQQNQGNERKKEQMVDKENLRNFPVNEQQKPKQK